MHWCCPVCAYAQEARVGRNLSLNHIPFAYIPVELCDLKKGVVRFCFVVAVVFCGGCKSKREKNKAGIFCRLQPVEYTSRNKIPKRCPFMEKLIALHISAFLQNKNIGL